jgi:hypothetical protein
MWLVFPKKLNIFLPKAKAIIAFSGGRPGELNATPMGIVVSLAS